MHAYKLINKSEITKIEASIQDALSKWALDWLNLEKCDIKIENAFETDNVNVFKDAHYNRDGIMILSESKIDCYLKALFGTDQIEVSLEIAEVRRVCDASFHALAEIFIKKIHQDEAPEFEKIFLKGSGWVVTSISMENYSLKLLFKPLIQSGNHKHDKTLSPLIELVKPEKLMVDVFMSGAEITAGELDQLQIGDVLELRHKINDPLKVLNRDGLFIGDASLGKIQDTYAIGYFVHKP